MNVFLTSARDGVETVDIDYTHRLSLALLPEFTRPGRDLSSLIAIPFLSRKMGAVPPLG